MTRNVLTKQTIDKIYSLMREQDVTSSDMCRALNIDYPCFKAMLDGKQPCFGKWRKKIAEVLNTDRTQLFGEKAE